MADALATVGDEEEREEEQGQAMGSEDSLASQTRGARPYKMGNYQLSPTAKLSTPFAAFLQFSAPPQFHCIANSTRHCQHDNRCLLVYDTPPVCCVRVLCVHVHVVCVSVVERPQSESPSLQQCT